MKYCTELLFSIMCLCFALVLLTSLIALGFEDTVAFVIIVVAVISAITGLVIGLHGYIASRNENKN